MLYIGVDIGGTNTVWGMVDANNNYLQEGSFLTQPETGADYFVLRLTEAIKENLKKLSDKYVLEGIGFAAPGANYYTGIIETAVNLNWGKVRFLEKIKKYFDVPIVFLNDANAAALGELNFGIAKDMKNFIVLTLGTGLGSGIIVNGNLLIGQSGLAGEVGHSVVEVNGRQCGCGKRGCLETYISAPGLKRTVFAMLCDFTQDSELRKIDYASLSSKTVVEFAAENDPIAIKALEYTGEILGRALSNMVTYFDPEAIILFGGLADAGELLMKPVRDNFEKYLLDAYKGKIKLLKSRLQNGRAAVLGACAFIKQEQSKKQVA